MTSLALVDLLLTGLLVAVWLFQRPIGYDADDSATILAVFVAVVVGGLGWYFGRHGCLLGCGFHLARGSAFIWLFILSFSAYNPHMDNGCGFDEGCIDRAQGSYAVAYGLQAFALVGSAVGLFVSQGNER